MPQNTSDPFARIRRVGTGGPNYDLDTEAIITRLTQWQSFCSFRVTRVRRDGLDIEFDSLPKDIDAFIRDLVAFCPDLDGDDVVPAGGLYEIIKHMKEHGEPLTSEMEEFAAGIDFQSENWNLEVLKREIQKKMKVKLWWD
jgi:hypothetical protein